MRSGGHTGQREGERGGEGKFSNNMSNPTYLPLSEQMPWRTRERSDVNLRCPKSIFVPAYLSEPLANV